MTPNDRERNYLQSSPHTPGRRQKEVQAFDTAAFLRQRYDRLLRRAARRAPHTRPPSHRPLLERRAGILRDDGAHRRRACASLHQRSDAASRGGNGGPGLVPAGDAPAGDAYERGVAVRGNALRQRLQAPSSSSCRTPRNQNAAAPRSLRELVVEDVTFAYPESDLASTRRRFAPDRRRRDRRARRRERLRQDHARQAPRRASTSPERGPRSAGTASTSHARSGRAPAPIAMIFQDFDQLPAPRAREHRARPSRARSTTSTASRGGRARPARTTFIAALPDGYDTMLGREFSGGHDLSVGQWQRVALARRSSATRRS